MVPAKRRQGLWQFYKLLTERKSLNFQHSGLTDPHAGYFRNLVASSLFEDKSSVNFYEDPDSSFCLKLQTERQTDTQTDKQTDKPADRQTNAGYCHKNT